MKRSLLLLTFIFVLVGFSNAQTSSTSKDAESIDSIITALYDVISGDSGVERDWDRFRSLFTPDAKLMPTVKDQKTGEYKVVVLTPEDYIKRAGPGLMKDGFHEREVSKKTETFGNIAHVFSTYETFKAKTDKSPFMRGINSIQLINDGKRWWILSVFWQSESDTLKLPKKYLKK